MADIITVQDLRDASLDAQALEQFINGDDAQDVLTRLNAKYPTIKKALKKLFSSGGLPATPFYSYDAMSSSELPNDSLAIVLFGSASGLYVKRDGAWKETDFSQDYQKFASALKDIADYIKATSNPDNILQLVDNNDVVVVSIELDGGLRLTNLDGTIQDEINSIKKGNKQSKDIISRLNVMAGEDSLLILVDDNDVVVLEVKADGDVRTALYDKGISKQLADDMRDIKLNNKAFNTGYHKDVFNKLQHSQRVEGWLSESRLKYGNNAPVPKNMLGGDFAIGDTWLNNVTVDLSKIENRQKIAGIDYKFKESVGVVHPYIVEFPDKVAGYKYWLAITGYTNSDDIVENVFIYGTNNSELKDWQLIEGFPAPFLNAPIDGYLGSQSTPNAKSHHSDVGICYDPHTGDLVVYWRVSLYYKNEAHYKHGVYGCRYDGNGWSEPYFIYEPVFANGGDQLLSPAIIHNANDNMFYMFYVNAANLFYRKAPNLLGGGWSERDFSLVNHNGTFWHLEAKNIGDKIALLIHADDSMSNGGTDSLYFATTTNGKNVNISSTDITTSSSNGFYKSSFLPHVDKNNLSNSSFHIVYTTDGSSNPMFQLGVAKTNTVNLGV